MVFFTRTAHGTPRLSTLLLQMLLLAHPYQGSCQQGNGGVPLLFLSISSLSVDYMHGKGFVAHLILAFSTSIFCIIGVLYVDDMDLFAIAEYPLESAEQVVCCMKKWFSIGEDAFLSPSETLTQTNVAGCQSAFIGMTMDSGIITQILQCPSASPIPLVRCSCSSICFQLSQQWLWVWYRQWMAIWLTKN